MGTVIIKNVVVRKPGFLYYVDSEGNLCEAKMNHKGRIKKENK